VTKFLDNVLMGTVAIATGDLSFKDVWGQKNTTNSSEMKIGTVNIQTQATDAAGIAKSFGGAMVRYGFVNQAQTGGR
jgi:hypothetical protein